MNAHCLYCNHVVRKSTPYAVTNGLRAYHLACKGGSFRMAAPARNSGAANQTTYRGATAEASESLQDAPPISSATGRGRT